MRSRLTGASQFYHNRHCHYHNRNIFSSSAFNATNPSVLSHQLATSTRTNFPSHTAESSLQAFSTIPASSRSKMRDRFPAEISEIPLTGFPLGRKIKLSVDHASKLSTLRAELLVVAARQTATTTTTESLQSANGNKVKKTEAVVTANADVDCLVKGELSRLISRREFVGSEGKTALVRLPPGFPFEEVALLGLGVGLPDQSTILDGYDTKKSHSTNCISSYAAAKLGKPLASLTSSIKAKSVVLHVETCDFSVSSFQTFIESFLIANCPDERFKSQTSEGCLIESLTILVDSDVEMFASAISRAKVVAAGIQLARELTAAPPNYCNPETLAKAAVQIAKDNGLKHVVLGEEECFNRRMGCYLAVNQGSMYEPQFIHLTYTPEGEVKRRIAFIGKGICMDTGGYNLKTLGGIETMKMDMGGAAAVFGCASIIGAMKPKNVEVHFICAAAENMIDSKAYRPGDVVTASSGATVEVGNTDAEGRLTLADALVYAETEIKPDAILDCATLTGACITALGQNIAAVYSQNSDWMCRILNGAKRSGSPLWPMPLFADYKKLNEGKSADVCNVPSSRMGGSITAALFLSEFVKETPWAHIDLAGPVYDPSSKEFTGYGAKILAEIVFGMEHL